jgi:thymidylate kinase
VTVVTNNSYSAEILTHPIHEPDRGGLTMSVPGLELDDTDFRLTMHRHTWPGKLIAVSGIDASGKTTLIRCIAAALRSQSIVTKRYKFPSRQLKETALFREFDRDRQRSLERGVVDPFGLTMVLMGDRLLTLRNQIRRHLRAGHRVIVDRYLFTTLVEFLLSPHSPAERRVIWKSVEMFPRPDCYLVADVPVTVAADRLRGRGKAEADTVDLPGMSARARLFREFALANGGVLVRTDVGLPQSVGLVRDHLIAAGAMGVRTRTTWGRI